MSKYTTQLRWLIETYAEDETLPITSKIEASLPKIFDFQYPIWTEEYRRTLEKKIVTHYLLKEIGYETVGLWKLFLNERLNLIMPYYNKLYETTTKDYDFLADTNLKEEFKNKKISLEKSLFGNENIQISLNKETINSKSDTSGENTNLRSDFPQANTAGLDYGTNLDKLNSKEGVTGNSTTNSDVNGKTTGYGKSDLNTDIDDNYTRTTTGARGSSSLTSLILQYRDSLINIDKMVIDELQDLFMTIY